MDLGTLQATDFALVPVGALTIIVAAIARASAQEIRENWRLVLFLFFAVEQVQEY